MCMFLPGGIPNEHFSTSSKKGHLNGSIIELNGDFSSEPCLITRGYLPFTTASGYVVMLTLHPTHALGSGVADGGLFHKTHFHLYPLISLRGGTSWKKPFHRT